MGGKIRIDQKKVEKDAVQLSGAASCLRNVPLGSQDRRTTLKANAESKAAYERFQERILTLGALLDTEVENIRGLGAAFAEFDEMTGQLARLPFHDQKRSIVKK